MTLLGLPKTCIQVHHHSNTLLENCQSWADEDGSQSVRALAKMNISVDEGVGVLADMDLGVC